MLYRISRLGYVEVRCLDLDEELNYYTNVLGPAPDSPGGQTGVSEGMGDERHAYSIAPGKEGDMHHLAFAVDPVDAIFRATDILVMNKVDIDFGPGRHGITRGTTIYFFDPSGNRLQTFGGYTAYQMDPDARPTRWTESEIFPRRLYYERKIVGGFLTRVT